MAYSGAPSRRSARASSGDRPSRMRTRMRPERNRNDVSCVRTSAAGTRTARPRPAASPATISNRPLVAFVQLEPAKGSALDIPAEPLAGCQQFLARSARPGPPCGSQRVQNSRNEPHSGPITRPLEGVHRHHRRGAGTRDEGRGALKPESDLRLGTRDSRLVARGSGPESRLSDSKIWSRAQSPKPSPCIVSLRFCTSL